MLAVVLAKKNWREDDQLATLYTREKGRMDVLVKGAKKITGKNTAGLEAGFLVDAEIIFNKNIPRLIKSVPLLGFKNMRESYEKIVWLNKILFFFKDNTRENEVDENVFDLLIEFLDAFDRIESDVHLLRESFLMKYLVCSGFLPELKCCVKCGTLVQDKSTEFMLSPEQGGLLCSSRDCHIGVTLGQKLSLVEIGVLQNIRDKNWTELSELNLSEDSKKLINRAVFEFGEYVLGKNLAYFA